MLVLDACALQLPGVVLGKHFDKSQEVIYDYYYYRRWLTLFNICHDIVLTHDMSSFDLGCLCSLTAQRQV